MNYQNVLFLVGGIFLVVLGYLPLMSDKYFNYMNENFWSNKTTFLPKDFERKYNRSYRHITTIGFGIGLIIYALNKLFF